MYLLFPVYFAIIKITHNEFKENAMDPQIILLKQSELPAEKESELCLLLSEEERTDLNKIRDNKVLIHFGFYGIGGNFLFALLAVEMLKIKV